MLEFLTGTGLAISAGLNAYIPLLLIGLVSRFTALMELPENWAWLGNEWVLLVLAVLLVIEFFADKIPGVDSVNDWVQTVVRPTAGGLAFGSGATSQTVAVTDPATFFESNQWVPIATGVILALGVHLTKMFARPVINAATLGIGAPVASLVEDATSVTLALLALVVPVLVVVAIAALVFAAVRLLRRAGRMRRARGPAGVSP